MLNRDSFQEEENINVGINNQEEQFNVGTNNQFSMFNTQGQNQTNMINTQVGNQETLQNFQIDQMNAGNKDAMEQLMFDGFGSLLSAGGMGYDMSKMDKNDKEGMSKFFDILYGSGNTGNINTNNTGSADPSNKPPAFNMQQLLQLLKDLGIKKD